MKRYAVKITDNNGRVTYEAIGVGQSESRQEAHLYTREDLAEKKAQQYRKGKQWYRKAEVVPVEVLWGDEPVVDTSGSMVEEPNCFMFSVTPDPVPEEKCEHTPGKFLGQSISGNYDRYNCAKCGKEFSIRVPRYS